MSHTRFELILQHIKYTKLNPPTYKDRFWEVLEMLEEWNKNMATNVVPSWINCIDELMSKWLNKYTCPGFMFIPCKPWPFGNEYHDTGCTDSNIIWSLELHEGKDRPLQLNNKQFRHVSINVLGDVLVVLNLSDKNVSNLVTSGRQSGHC